MFNQFSQHRPFSPSNQPRRAPGKPFVSGSNSQGSFSAQIRPDFMKPQQQSGGATQPVSVRKSRIKPDAFQSISPQSQRAALFDQARQQAAQLHQANYQTMRNPSSALPGGLSEKQRMDLAMLQRTNPLAAQAQLQQYQRNADIRYNKPGVKPPSTPGAGLTYRRPPGGPTGPRRTFGA